jgi:hypothetical protein
LLQACERRVDPREHWGLSELGKDPPCLTQVLNRVYGFFPGLVQEAKGHMSAAYVMSRRMEMRILQGDC